MAGVEKQKKILIVEDEAVMREIVMRKLVTNNFKVVEADNGRTAIDIWIKEKPDLVLLDLMLPEIDGFQILETIRANPDPAIHATPVIVLSNLWTNQDILKAQNLKIDGYLVKAYFTTEEILTKVNFVLAGSHKIS